MLKRLADVTGLQEMVDRAYQDVIQSREYGYHRFVSDIDEAIEQAGTLDPPHERQRTFALVRIDGQNESWSAVTPHLPLTAPITLRSAPPPDRLLKGRARDLWLRVPEKVRTPLSALLGPPARRVKALLRP
ncbi:hypothetical protein ABIB82_005267 [Bradyrhizobium sp. i1.8.4]|uniref:hypothetical protein n=1 Tax=unclassified Bradyrhizobium TaxID=2631580 RepID=UPI003D216AE5